TVRVSFLLFVFPRLFHAPMIQPSRHFIPAFLSNPFTEAPYGPRRGRAERGPASGRRCARPGPCASDDVAPSPFKFLRCRRAGWTSMLRIILSAAKRWRGSPRLAVAGSASRAGEPTM
ncbi:hypothetical protein DFH09DRAFT_1188059, partial [Mycena vulgaris]